MAPLLRPKGMLRAFQSAVHSPRGKACLAVQTTLASSRVLAGPRAQAFLISPIHSVTACGASANNLSVNLIVISEGEAAWRISARNDLLNCS